MADLVEILDDSSGEVECYLDPDSEVFFGPLTDKEREVRKPLPRRTLHPCEITEISKRGMNFHEWEEFKEQIQRNQLNDEAIYEVFGKDDTTESFASCYTSRESEPKILEATTESIGNSTDDQSFSELTNQSNDREISGIESLNDTWEFQERMLAYAERLERGEDIPELGICNSVNKTEDSHFIKSEREVVGAEEEKENIVESSTVKKEIESLKPKIERLTSPIKVKREPETRIMQPISQLVNEMGALSVVPSALPKTPTKFPTPARTPKPVVPSRTLETPVKTPRLANQRVLTTPTSSSNRPASSIKQTSTLKQKQHYSTPSPVGMYIRSLPEPILIQNVHSVQRKKQVSVVTCAKPAAVAVKLEDGRWTTVEEHVKCPPETSPVPEDYKPVLPVVLHEAAATIINETPAESSLPGTTGKIGQLLQRAFTPVVLKHQGRIQLPKSTSRPSRVIEPRKTVRTERTKPDVMEVSVLENVSTPRNYRPVRLVQSARK